MLKSNRDVIMKVLDRIGEMPTRTLSTMYRRLKGVCGSVPQLCPPRSGWSRDHLIKQVRLFCLEMIGHLGDYDVLPDPLAKSMAVACLSSKLAPGYLDVSLIGISHFTPDPEVVQNEISKAIRLLGEIIKKDKIKVQHLLDPKSTMDSKGFLYECWDVDTIPNSLLDALSVINETSSHRAFSKVLIEEQVEGLNMSASLKQILLDHTPGDKFDEDFTDAYMEQLVESDDGHILMMMMTRRRRRKKRKVQNTGDPEEGGCSSSQGDSSSSSSGVTKLLSDDECMGIETSASKMFFSTFSWKDLPPLDMPMLDCDDMERQDAAKGDSSRPEHAEHTAVDPKGKHKPRSYPGMFEAISQNYNPYSCR
ncbi:hypothetical protein Cgig2_033784 [Carnegiea gigantea]|uniref:Uncharacterized protein n=1 Tax=Carnegiea gigantea TaxID=171969 RepID=A0A9Q1QJ18_9CARY|nr:hypothetical protein Cgig2_033784 [Carnegiea gigantea]